MAKGGGSANKSFLFQETKAILNPKRMLSFLDEKIRSLGTAACPPYHLAVVIGGTSAEFALKTAKYASAHYLDNLPTEGSMSAHGFRDLELEEEVFKLTQSFGIGAQFGGKYFCHDVRVVRLPRHGASCPVAIAVSCSADRQALGKITAEGVFLEQLETDPAHYLPDTEEQHLIQGGEVVKIDLTQPMSDILATLSQHPVKTRLSLTGPLVVARDIAHAKIQERLDAGEEMPQYLKDHPVYYAGPAKTPEGYASGSFGPTTAGRMDSYVKSFQAAGGSMVMLAKGNRSKQVTEACNEYGGFYLGSIGGPAARLAQDCIKSVEVLEYPELGMEAVWKIEVEDFPAFIVVDDKGNDFFTDPSGAVNVPLSSILGAGSGCARPSSGHAESASGWRQRESGNLEHPLDPFALQVTLRPVRELAEPLRELQRVARGDQHVVVRLDPAPPLRHRHPPRRVVHLGADPPYVGGDLLDRPTGRGRRLLLDQVQRPAGAQETTAVAVPFGQHPQRRQDGDDHPDREEQALVHDSMVRSAPRGGKGSAAAAPPM